MSGTQPTLTGRELGNYVLGPLIGRGGMGEVYAAKHKFLGTDVAIKTLRGAFADDESVAKRFFLEARAAVEVAHANVVRVLDFGKTDDGTLYLTMERLYGRSLGAEIAHGPLPVTAATYIATLVCAGLGAAHKKGIIHRDLKPDNVFLTDTEVKVLDFGIARVLSQVSATSQGTVVGTPLYMAPEQLRSSQNVGPTADVYSLGAMLFEMITGRTPFRGDTASQLFASHLFEPVPKVRSLLPVERKLDKIIESCLAKTPEERPQSMDELASLLQPFVGTSPALPPSRVIEQEREVANPHARTADVARMSTFDPSGPRFSTLSRAASEIERSAPRSSSPWRVGAPLFVGFAIAVGGYAIYDLRTPRHTAPPSVAPVAAASPAPSPATTPAPATTSTPTPAPAVDAPAADIVLRSDPPGARVSVGDDVLGTTPLVLRRSLPLTVMYTLHGYQNEVLTLREGGEHSTKLHRTHRDAPATRPAVPTEPTPKGESLD